MWVCRCVSTFDAWHEMTVLTMRMLMLMLMLMKLHHVHFSHHQYHHHHHHCCYYYFHCCYCYLLSVDDCFVVKELMLHLETPSLQASVVSIDVVGV